MSVRFAGYAAVFDRVDSGGDIVRRGAFAEALKRAGEVPLLLQHKAGRVLGGSSICRRTSAGYG